MTLINTFTTAAAVQVSLMNGFIALFLSFDLSFLHRQRWRTFLCATGFLPHSRRRSISAAGNGARCRCGLEQRCGPRVKSQCLSAHWYTEPEPRWSECTRGAGKEETQEEKEVLKMLNVQF